MQKIIINRKRNTFKLVDVKNNISIKSVETTIQINGSSKRGLPGPKGEGVASGGQTGDFLVKESNADNDNKLQQQSYN